MGLRNSELFSICYSCVKLKHGLQNNFLLCINKRSISTKNTDNNNEERFNKVLIANRGEIACRIIKTAKRMGIKTVAVYSVADQQAKHLKLADECIFIGPSESTKSYLDISKILRAIRISGSDAVHPGYGFLSENAEFVRELEGQNVAFIGPSAEAITRMGDKLESKRTAMAAGVNVIPGFHEIIRDAEHCVEISRNIGYPVIIKASAGGGGKGMRVARNDQEAREGYFVSTQEATSAFGDGRMLIEKFLENPRHIEIQVLGDRHGNVIHLNERECSIQRRNQKVIEEAPSVFLNESTRKAMGDQAVSLCKTLNYHSAGTVEFLVDENRKFYFLEMNTRLQVEHPVTEFITNIDIVEQMFKIAKGHKLELTQDDIKINGWAIESRIYAENPYKYLGMPNGGYLYKYEEPPTGKHTRFDSGVEEGSKISMYYDPLICKLVCHGRDREDAIEKSTAALDSYVIRGITHNIPLLRNILTQDKFRAGDINTTYLTKTYPRGFKGMKLNENEIEKLLVVTAALYAQNELRNSTLVSNSNTHVNGKRLRKWNLVVNFENKKTPVKVSQSNNHFVIEMGSERFYINKKDLTLSESIVKVKIKDEKPCIFQILSKTANGEYNLIFLGNNYKLNVFDEKVVSYLELMPKRLAINKPNEVRSPMSGLVKSVFRCVGDRVCEGQELCIIEAMKMQNVMTAPSTGIIKSINVKIGDKVTDEDVLVELQ